jgi:alkanesulfonate monooxygenase SsuD/methylene tetrahydromethanopterin reductase-like flavin-dependent oxidoreductase (luciferase family)
MKERMMNAWEDFDREGEPQIAVARPVHVGTDTERSTDQPLVGEPESILEDIETYAEAGTTRLILTTYDISREGQLEQISRFGDEIISAI